MDAVGGHLATWPAASVPIVNRWRPPLRIGGLWRRTTLPRDRNSGMWTLVRGLMFLPPAYRSCIGLLFWQPDVALDLIINAIIVDNWTFGSH